MKYIFLLFIVLSTSVYAQKKKHYGPDVVSNVEVRATVMKPLGNNFLAKDLQTFYGFGFGGNLMTPINFGIGLDYNVLFSNVRLGHENMAGNINGQVLNNVDVYITHRNKISEDFFLEEFAGGSYYVLKSQYSDGSKTEHRDSGTGFHAGLKPLYNLDREGYQQVFLAGKINFYFSNVANSDRDIEKYYSNSVLLSLSFGYRYNF